VTSSAGSRGILDNEELRAADASDLVGRAQTLGASGWATVVRTVDNQADPAAPHRRGRRPSTSPPTPDMEGGVEGHRMYA
jgi:hypothetical protein